MSSTGIRESVDSELEALRYAFRELLILKEGLVFQRTFTARFRKADRRMLRIHRSLERQSLKLAVDLNLLGVTSSELSRIISEAKSIARSRRRVAHSASE